MLKTILNTIFILAIPLSLLSKDNPNYTTGIAFFRGNIHWENRFSNEKFDDLGTDLYITPSLEMRIRSLSFGMDLQLCSAHIDGPDGLTLTTPDDDIDSGFRTNMHRRNAVLRAGYILKKYLTFSLSARYQYLKLEGHHKREYRVQYDYLEKGFLFGPELNIRIPLIIAKLFINLSYHAGYLNTDYDPGRKKEDQLNSNIFNSSSGIEIPAGKKLSIGISYNYEYMSKGVNPQDVRLDGLSAMFLYNF